LESHKVSYGNKEIEFLLERKTRKTLKITVNPDKTVVATAPKGIELDKIMNSVKNRSRWILKQQDYFDEFFPKQTPRKYIGGESHYYLGKQYRLKIIESDKNEVKLKSGYFIIHTKKKDDKNHSEALLYTWYKIHSKIKFKESIQRCMKIIKKYDIENPDFSIRKMKARWGSCSKDKNKIILNLELIKAPSHCIEYVVMHELCHLKYPNHSKSFWDFLSLVMPDWKMRKERLEKIII
jgi:hypothetical protein